MKGNTQKNLTYKGQVQRKEKFVEKINEKPRIKEVLYRIVKEILCY